MNTADDLSSTVKGDTVEGIGEVTMLEECLPKGIIDGTYFFNKDLAAPEIEKGSKVEFSAKLSDDDPPQWDVTTLKLYVSPETLANAYRRKFIGIIGKVVSVDDSFVTVKYGRDVKEDVQIVPVACLPQDYAIWIGDYLNLKLELNDPDGDDDGGKIHSVEPTNKKKIVGRVTCSKGRFCIDNYIYFDQTVCLNGRRPSVWDSVSVVAVESQQGYFTWRAVSVKPARIQAAAVPGGSDAWTSACCSDSLKELMKEKHNVKIEPKCIFFPEAQIGSTVEGTAEIQNVSDDVVTLENVIVKCDEAVSKFRIRRVEEISSEADQIQNIIIPPKSIIKLIVTCYPEMVGSSREMIVFNFGNFEIGRQLVVTALPSYTSLMAGLTVNESGPGNERGQRDAGYNKMTEDVNRPVVRGVNPLRAPFFMQKRLENNPVPRYMWSILEKEDDRELFRKHPGALEDLKIQNYLDKFRTALWLEEMENDVLRRQYDLEKVCMRYAGDCLAFEVPGLKDIHPQILTGDPISVLDLTDPNETRYEAFINDIRGEDVYAKFDEDFRKSYRKTPVTIRFCLGRTTYKRCHFAIEQSVRHLGEDWLFPGESFTCKLSRIPFVEDVTQDILPNTESHNAPKNQSEPCQISDQKENPARSELNRVGTGRNLNRRIASLKCPFQSDTQGPSGECLKLTWFNKSLNEEQRDAVRRILRGQSRPLPYIVYGPPGTGKTVTIVEAIIQVNKLDRNSRVLVVTPSNSAADVIASNLVSSGQFVIGDFVRLVGFLRNESQIPEDIRDFCKDGEYLDAVARHRLIVCTCITAGQFFQLGLDTGHFTHVFVDEAGYCTEPEALIGASLVALDRSGQVILAGDPKQLGPVLMSDPAGKCGLAKSLLERLMSLPLYSRNEAAFPKEKYNPLVLTKLLKNYRAHPVLLKLPSKLFYDDELEAAASDHTINLSQRLDFMKDRPTPLIFHGIQAPCAREPNSPSWYNASEVIQVVDYVRLFRRNGVPSENIGIITPYRKQVEKLRNTLELGLLTSDIPKVGSVEEFQGGERDVMIMSLVRSAKEKDLHKVADRLAFIFSPKRFNVAITRAKAMLVVVGNPHVLVHDPIWCSFLQYCVELGCYIGCKLPLSLQNGDHKFTDNWDQEW